MEAPECILRPDYTVVVLGKGLVCWDRVKKGVKESTYEVEELAVLLEYCFILVLSRPSVFRCSVGLLISRCYVGPSSTYAGKLARWYSVQSKVKIHTSMR